jgi:Tfp pilus assembly protein PilF
LWAGTPLSLESLEPPMSRTEQFEQMLASGHDSAMLRFSLGNEYLRADDPASAGPHLRRAVELDPGYSAAWKALGTALERDGALAQAADAYQRGVEAAEDRGDKQAAKEMRVYLRRLQKRGA